MSQPKPAKNENSKVVYDLVQQDLKNRYEHGLQEYGTPLTTHNGRDALKDLYEEILDSAMYVRQKIEEEKTDSLNIQIKLLDKGYIEYIDHMGDDLAIVNAARVSLNSYSNEFTERDKNLLRFLYENKHTSPFEQTSIKLRVKCPIFVARQWMRHRTWSYNEISRRYTSENIEFYIPFRLHSQSDSNRQASNGFVADALNQAFLYRYRDHCEQSLLLYNEMIGRGVSREDARGILPVCLYTEFIGTVNLHNLLQFCLKRISSENNIVQDEIQRYAEAIYHKIIPQLFPKTYEMIKNL